MTTGVSTSYEGKESVVRERHAGGATVLIYRAWSQEVFLRRGHLNGLEGKERANHMGVWRNLPDRGGSS